LLPARNCEEFLPGYFESVSGFADAIVALDDGSTDRTGEILDGHPLVQVKLTNPRREGWQGWDDARNRNQLLHAAAALEPDWIISLDADERVPADDGAVLRNFVECEALSGFAYLFKVYRMVNDQSHYDRASLWVARLFAFEPGVVFSDRRLHLKPVPKSIPKSRWLKTTIRIQHFGGLTKADRRRRFEKYLQADPENVYQDDYRKVLALPAGVKEWQPRPPDLPALVRPHLVDKRVELKLTELDLDGPALSAVIISKDDEQRIEKSVRSVVEQKCPEPFEVIVVTSGTDRTAEIVREKFPQVRLVELPHPALPGAARNAGLAIARGDFISFPGSHVELTPGSLAVRMRDHELGYAMVTGTVLNGTRSRAGWAAYFLEQSSCLPGRPSGLLKRPPTHCSYTREALLDVGGFPENMRAGEDTMVNRELHRLGYSAYRDQDLMLVHNNPCPTAPQLIRHFFVRGQAWGRILLSARWRRRRKVLHLVRYAPRRVSVISRNVERWGGDLALEYRRSFPLLIAGALASWAGVWFEILRRNPAKYRIPRGSRRRTLSQDAIVGSKGGDAI
jgi:glycosyltransferase involved in cell wall biosynthesis